MLSHVSLPERKALLGKVAVLHAIDDHAHVLRTGELMQLLRESTSQWVREQITVNTNGTPLGTAIDALGDALNRSTAHLPDTQLTQDLLERVRNVAANRRCEKCNCGGQPCNGDPQRDDEIAIQGGACLTPLIEVFEFALELARSLYQAHEPAAATMLWTEVRFSTLDQRDEVHHLPTDIQVSANVDRRGTPTITLVLWVERFEWDAYLVLPYVLFHEALIHLAENASHGAKPTPALPGHPFVEGWMDWLAKEVVLEQLNQGGGGPPWKTPSAAIHELYASRIKRVPAFDSVGRERLQEASNRRLGAIAAERFSKFLQQPYVHQGNGLTLFRELSLRLNYLATPDSVKEEFVATIGRFLSGPNPPLHPGSYELAHAVHEYIARRDIEAFLTSILRLSQQYSVDK